MTYQRPEVKLITNVRDLFHRACATADHEPRVSGWAIETHVAGWTIGISPSAGAGPPYDLVVRDPGGRVRAHAYRRADVQEAMESAISTLVVRGVQVNRGDLMAIARDVDLGRP